MRSFAAVLALLATAVPAAAGEVKRNLADEGALATFASAFGVAWNRHDAKALAAFFTPDADLINPFGREAKGAAEIQKLFEEEHTTFLKSTRFKASARLPQWVRQDVTVTTWDATVEGMLGPGGRPAPTLSVIVTAVMVKVKEAKEEKWLCASLRAMAPLPAPAK